MKWQASAPSNIALIKYMGKIGHQGNISSNSSLSYTLEHLRTFVELEPLANSATADVWQPLTLPGQNSLEISSQGQSRFLKHLAFLKTKMNYSGNFLIRSNNNFPSDCGLASSASSFAALTLCTYNAIRELKGSIDFTLPQLADLSRQGSGSSCRSLFSPWSLWNDTGADQIALPYQELLHQVIVVSDQIKLVSSSEAHKRINSSLLTQGRTDRAETRIKELIAAMRILDWKKAYEIIWADYWDMHALFETSHPPFGYMSSGSLAAVRTAQEPWLKHSDGPWITMDAGPNVHLLYRPDQKELALTIEHKLKSQFKVIGNFGG